MVSIDINAESGYFYHLPIVALSWRRVGYEPIFLVVTSNESEPSRQNVLTLSYLAQMKARVVYFKTRNKLEKVSSQMARTFVGLMAEADVKERDFVLTSDADLYPVNGRLFQVADDDSVKVWNGACCGSFKYKEKSYTMYPMGKFNI